MGWKWMIGCALIALALIPLELTAQVRIELSELRQKKGTVRIALFDAPDNYLLKPVDSLTILANTDPPIAVFENLAPGRYAFALFHDLNENGELDRNWLGIPSEPFAFSNNSMGRFSEPSWEQASFELKQFTETQYIELRHLSF